MLMFTRKDFFNEIMKATLKVTKFMGAAFLITDVHQQLRRPALPNINTETPRAGL